MSCACPEEPLPVGTAPVLRCNACGRRIAGRCALHGAPPAAGEGDADAAPEPAPRGIEGVRVTRLIARGGFGAVFEGAREADGSRVAIKVAHGHHEDAAALFDHEAEALARVGAPHVPALLARGVTDDGRPYLVMEHLAAPTLAERLTGRLTPMSIDAACGFVRGILDALHHVHAAGYVHCDLKPENVLVDGPRRAVLIDFGLALARDERDAREITLDGVGVGTPEYMAPEQCEGLRDVDARADVYAVGIILFELLAGRPPFWGPRAVVREACASRRPPLVSAMREGPPLPRALERVVARCLAKDPRDRFASAAELAVAIDAARVEIPLIDVEMAHAVAAMEGPAPAPRGADRATVGVVFFETSLDVAAVRAEIEALGGHVGEASNGRVAGVFTEGAADDPARRARRAAEELCRVGVCARARVDLARVAVRARRDGTPVFWSPAFSRVDRFPSEGDPRGVSIAPAAEVARDEGPEGSTSSSRPFVGRASLVASLVASARRAVIEARPTIVRVTGDAGLGKSRLAQGLVAELAASVDVIALRAPEPALGDADRALERLLDVALDLPTSPPESGARALLCDRVGADLAPAVALAVGWIDGDDDASPLAIALRAQGAAPGAVQSALVVAAGEALRRRASRGGLALILDDAHLAGEVVLAALEYAARADARAPIWICALGRPSLAVDRPAFGDGAAIAQRHEIGPLDAESAAALCRALLVPALDVPDAVVERLVARAERSPLLLTELARGLRREGIVRKSPKGEAWYVAADELDNLPSSPLVEWLARRELDALPPSLSSHARLSALLGERVTIDDIEGVLRRLEGVVELPLDAKVGARRLLAARVLVEDGAGRLCFRHALVREAVARAAPEAWRRRVHEAAAAHYRSSAIDEPRLAELAYHAGEAGLAGEAARAYFDLAERARARHAYLDAERLYGRALAEPAQTIDRGAALRGRGLVRARVGRYHDALLDLTRARDMARASGEVMGEIAILLDEATLLDWMDAYSTSASRVRDAVSRMPEVRSALLEARLLLGLGRSAFRQSRNAEAAHLLECAASAADPLGDDGYETGVIARILLGFLLAGLGRPEEARRALDQAVDLAESRGDRLHLGSALNVRGMLFGNLGDKASLVADMARSLAIARELGQASLELMGEFNLAEVLLLLDDADAAEPHIERAAALDKRISGEGGRADVALLRARYALHRGDEGGAADIVSRLRAREALLSSRGEGLLVPSDEVLCSMIELSLQGADSASWDALEARAARSIAQERIEIIEARGESARRRGHVDEARAHFERALAAAVESPNAARARIARRIGDLPR